MSVWLGREFLAVYLFDASGKLLDARIDNLGPRSMRPVPARETPVRCRAQWLPANLSRWRSDATAGALAICPPTCGERGGEYNFVEALRADAF